MISFIFNLVTIILKISIFEYESYDESSLRILYIITSLILSVTGFVSGLLFMKWLCNDTQENRKLLPRAIMIIIIA